MERMAYVAGSRKVIEHGLVLAWRDMLERQEPPLQPDPWPGFLAELVRDLNWPSGGEDPVKVGLEELRGAILRSLPATLGVQAREGLLAAVRRHVFGMGLTR